MRKSLLVATTVILVAGTQVWAIPILAGQAAIAAAESEPLNGTLVAGPLETPMIGTAFDAKVTSWVYENDESNPYGGLTFVYEIVNSEAGRHAIGRFTANGFSGFLTDLSFAIEQDVTDKVPPATMDRSLDGDVVGFSFVGPPLGPSVLVPGATSNLLIVQTDAPDYTTSIGNVINGSIASGAIYSPIPEPATMLFLLGGIGFLLRRR